MNCDCVTPTIRIELNSATATPVRIAAEVRNDPNAMNLLLTLWFIIPTFLLSSSAGTYSADCNSDIHHKNYMADQTNPNEYHSIDEHVYDEIKHKEGYKDHGKEARCS